LIEFAYKNKFVGYFDVINSNGIACKIKFCNRRGEEEDEEEDEGEEEEEEEEEEK
jgi:hypothetical protein